MTVTERLEKIIYEIVTEKWTGQISIDIAFSDGHVRSTFLNRREKLDRETIFDFKS